MTLINNPLLALRLKREWRYTRTAPLPLTLVFVVCCRVIFTFLSAIITAIFLCGNYYTVSAMISFMSARKSLQGWLISLQHLYVLKHINVFHFPLFSVPNVCSLSPDIRRHMQLKLKVFYAF